MKWNTWNGLEQNGVAWNGMGSYKTECWEHRIIMWTDLEHNEMAWNGFQQNGMLGEKS